MKFGFDLVSEKKILKVYFPYMNLCKTSGHLGGTIFDPHGYNLNNIGRGPQDKAAYQITKA